MIRNMLEQFALGMLYGVERDETPPRRPHSVLPQFTYGVRLQRRRETCEPEHKIFSNAKRSNGTASLSEQPISVQRSTAPVVETLNHVVHPDLQTYRLTRG